MSLFDQWVDEALKNRPDFAPLRMVVEKELLHYDILQTLSDAGMLAKLTFIGGTCLRACYGSNRLSEDLDFTGGADFNRKTLSAISHTLVDNLKIKYGLMVTATEPTREIGNVSTWKIKIQTRPDQKHVPAQRINIDICSIPSYESRPMMLLDNYRIGMGNSGLILQAESREEIFADKMLAFALRPNRIKYRDLWDIAWLHQQGVKLSTQLVQLKIKDHHCEQKHFLSLLSGRRKILKTDAKLALEFKKEMHRFLPAELVARTVEQTAFWNFLTNLVEDLDREIQQDLSKGKAGKKFEM